MSIIKGFSLFSIAIILFSTIIILNTSIGLNQLLKPQIYKNAIERVGVYQLFGSEEKGLLNTTELINNLVEKTVSYVKGETTKEESFIEIRINESGKKSITQKINILELFDKDGTLSKARTYISYYNTIIYALTIVIILLITTILVINGKKLNRSFLWVGITSLFAGIIVIISASTVGNLIYTAISMSMPKLQPGITEIITPLFHSIKISGIITLIAGFVLTIAAIFVSRGEEKEEEKNTKKIKEK